MSFDVKKFAMQEYQMVFTFCFEVPDEFGKHFRYKLDAQ